VIASDGQPRAAMRTARIENLAAPLGGHAGPEAVTALADDFGWLPGALHGRELLECCGQRTKHPTRCRSLPAIPQSASQEETHRGRHARKLRLPWSKRRGLSTMSRASKRCKMWRALSSPRRLVGGSGWARRNAERVFPTSASFFLPAAAHPRPFPPLREGSQPATVAFGKRG
jgi:hypothetical protein